MEIPGEPAAQHVTSENASDPATDTPQVISGLSATATRVELEVVGVRVEVPSNQPIVLIKEKFGDRYLPILIGPVEATAIALAQQRIAFPRPQTHDLMKEILESANIRLLSATFVALVDGVYYTDLNFSDGSTVSSRPSDAVSLVLRTRAPLYAAVEVLDEAGVAIRDDEQEGTQQ
jgi:bifunctional DNase/RNase